MDKNIKMNELISIILPTYNGGKYIKRAIESIISQTYSSWELLVIDDGSTDNTSDILRNYISKDNRIKYLKNDFNLGIQKTLNKGIKESKGEYIARIDDDDEWIDKDKLEKQINFLSKHQDCVLVGTGVIVVNEDGEELLRYLLPESNEAIKARILGKNCFVHSSVMFKRDVVLGLGGYNESKESRHIEDYDLWLRLGTIGKLANLPVYAVKFTSREGSLTAVNRVEIFKKIIKLIKNYKNSYPNYFWALLRSIARVVVYGVIIKTPIRFFLNRIIKIYKEN